MQLTFDTVQPLSIFEFNQRIGRMFSKADWLRDVWVEGEVSNFKRYASGHAYFTLKDDRSQLKCVMWKTSITRHSYLPTDGERVRAHGSVDTYIDNGIYQLYADVLQPAGLGDLHQQFEHGGLRIEKWDMMVGTVEELAPQENWWFIVLLQSFSSSLINLCHWRSCHGHIWLRWSRDTW
mgnify:CR=1 FL=1